MSMTLYAAPMSSATPVVTLLEELDVPYETVMFDLAEGKHREADYLAINPNGLVPALTVDGTSGFEAVAIMQWLAERYGVKRGLWPAADAPERLVAMSWSAWAYVSYGGNISRLAWASGERTPDELRSDAHAKHAMGELRNALKILDGELSAKPYLLGDEYSLADLIVACTVTYSSFLGAPVQEFEHVSAWLERFQARPAYQRTWNAAA